MNCISNDIPRRAVRRSWQSWCAAPEFGKLAGAPALIGALALIATLLPGCSTPAHEVQRPHLSIRVTEDGFVPRESFAPGGTPLTLVVTRQTDRTCAKQIVIAGMERTWELPLNRPVRIQLPHGIRDSLSFACGMDMYHGVVIAK